MIVRLISGPRNVSTALMYSFAQRADTRVMDEPFYAVYLSKTGLQHPGAEAVLRALPADERQVRAQLVNDKERPILFIKDMAHHVEVLEEPLIAGAVNIFLIRDPRQILASYTEVISKPVMRDIGIAYQYALFNRLRHENKEPVVIDAGFLLNDPVSVLTKICKHCGLDYDQRMAHWPAGPKPYDGVWAPYWYNNVHSTTGFTKPATHTRPVPAHLSALLAEAQHIYEKLLPFSINT
jgi:hypothetical protein